MTKEYSDLMDEFILDTDTVKEDLKALVSRLIPFCRPDKNGHVRLMHPVLKKAKSSDKILAILIARHLADHLQRRAGLEPTISEEVATDELARMIGAKPNVTAARVAELVKDGRALKVKRGVTRAAPHAIEVFISSLEATHGNQ